MQTIKTRNTVTGVKTLDKTVSLSKRMKDSYIRTKKYAVETQEPRGGSPSGYAVDSIQEKTQGAAQEFLHHIPNPRSKVGESIQRAKVHFQEVKSQLPGERRYSEGQAQKAAHKAKGSADDLRRTADQTRNTASEAKTAVKDAKQTLKQVRHKGRQTLREVKQGVKTQDNGKLRGQPGDPNPVRNPAAKPASSAKPAPNANSTPVSKPLNASANMASNSNLSQPSYLKTGASAPKNAGSTVSSVDKTAKNVKSAANKIRDAGKGTIKTAKKTVKTAEQSAKSAVKTAQQTAKAAQKTAQAAAKAAKAAEKAARAAAKAAVQTAKAVVKAVTAMVKLAIAAIKGLVAAIAAGGWVAVVIILIICLIAFLVGSVFGIFFSGEPDPGTGQTINSVIAEIDTEYTAQLDWIKSANAYDYLDMSGARAAWKQVLAVYTVRTVSDPDNPMEVATMTNEKTAILRSVFWEMNAISYSLDVTEIEEDVLGDDGLPTGETTTTTTTVLRITVSHKTADEMAALYGFSDEQKESLEELLKPEHHSLWNALLYGITSIGDGSMIEVAITQLGNVGGQPYWSWYGFSDRVAWCACFVAWVANECGFIESGVMPLFSYCPTGADLFRERGQWQDSTYTPSPGDIIFFDWEPDGETDHVGIVESVVNGVVNTIEGNTSDSVARHSYDIGSVKIYGYGVPKYDKSAN